MYENDKKIWCNVTYCAQKNNLPHSSSSYLWCSFIPELLCKYLPWNLPCHQNRGLFRYLFYNTWPRLEEPRCYIPRKGGCSATRSQLPRSDVFQTYLWDVQPGGMGGTWNALIDPPRAFPLFPPFSLFLKNAQVTIKQEMETTSVFPVAKIDKCWGRWTLGTQMEEQLIKERVRKCWVFMSKHN